MAIQFPRPAVVAHRGASSDLPENTLAAFEAAVEVNADMIELDVRLTADGVPVVLHDHDLGRTTDRSGGVHELTLAEVKRADASRGWASRQAVPTLAEVLELLRGTPTGVDVEIKNLPWEPGHDPEDAVVGAVLDVLADEGFSGSVLLSSFNPRTLERARALAPEVPTGLLTIAAFDAREALGHAVAGGHAAVLPQAPAVLEAGPGLVEACRDAGVALGTWTVDDEDTLATLFGWRVDAVATNRPALGVAVRDRVVP
jgi:glycerophosphoryl diester phosphodiesterase